MINELISWLKLQATLEECQGNDAREIEDEMGYPRLQSTGYYQRVVAYKKTLLQITRTRFRSSRSGGETTQENTRDAGQRRSVKTLLAHQSKGSIGLAAKRRRFGRK